MTFNNANAAVTSATFSQPGTYVLRLAADDSAASVLSDVTIVVNAVPALDPTVVEDFRSSTGFLYEDPVPIQTGVVPGTISPLRAAVIKGNVRDRTGALSGARISILNHPEFGETRSRADGMYDLVINGGGKLIVRVQRTGYFEVQRDVIVPWLDFVHAADVVLTRPDAAATVVDLAQPTTAGRARQRGERLVGRTARNVIVSPRHQRAVPDAQWHAAAGAGNAHGAANRVHRRCTRAPVDALRAAADVGLHLLPGTHGR